jgi:sugar phosphate isomerase/epimerase
LACQNLDCHGLVEVSGKYKIGGVEIRLTANNEIYGGSGRVSESHGKILSDAGIRVVDIGSGVCIKKQNETEQGKLRTAVDIAGVMGAVAVRVFLGNFLYKKTDPKEEIIHEEIVDMLKSGCAYAAVKNARIWVETHNEYSRGKILRKLMEDVSCDNIGIIWDVIHPLEEGESIAETYQYIGKYIEHVHIKDGRPHKDTNMANWEYTPIGEGQVPLKDIVNILDGAGYKGYYSLEWENVWKKELKKYPSDINWILYEFVKKCKNL